MWALHQRRRRFRFAHELLMRTALTGALAGLAGVLEPGLAHALPAGGSTTGVIGAPAVTITPNGPSELDITAQQPRSVIDWTSYAIAAGEKVQYSVGGPSWIVLNRVPTQITVDGTLTSVLSTGGGVGGNVWLVSPNGILFGANARVSVGGLLATTATPSLAGQHGFLDQSETAFDFLFAGPGASGYPFISSQGNDTFYPIFYTPPGSPAGVTVAAGAQITAGDATHGGMLAFIAPFVNTQVDTNLGTKAQISAPNSRILYGATNSYELTLGRQTSGDLDLVSFLVNDASDGSALQQAMNLEGTSTAASVHVVAVSTASVVNAVVKAPGAITATRSAVNGHGEIVLLSGETDTLTPTTDPVLGSIETLGTGAVPSLPAPVTFQTGALQASSYVQADVGALTAQTISALSTGVEDHHILVNSIGDVSTGNLVAAGPADSYVHVGGANVTNGAISTGAQTINSVAYPGGSSSSVYVYGLGQVHTQNITTASGAGGDGSVHIQSAGFAVNTGVINASGGSLADVNIYGDGVTTGDVTSREVDPGGSAGIYMLGGSGNVVAGNLSATGDRNGSVDLESSGGGVQAGAIATHGGDNGTVYLTAPLDIRTGAITTSSTASFSRASIYIEADGGAAATGTIVTASDTDASVTIFGQTVSTGAITAAETSTLYDPELTPSAAVHLQGLGSVSVGAISTSAPGANADVLVQSVGGTSYTDLRFNQTVTDTGPTASAATGAIQTSGALLGSVLVSAGGNASTGNISSTATGPGGLANVAVTAYTGAATAGNITTLGDADASVGVRAATNALAGAITTRVASPSGVSNVFVGGSNGSAVAGNISTSGGSDASAWVQGAANAQTGAISTQTSVVGGIAYVRVNGSSGSALTGAISTSGQTDASVSVHGQTGAQTGAIATSATGSAGDASVTVLADAGRASTGAISTSSAGAKASVSVHGGADVQTGAISTAATGTGGDASVSLAALGQGVTAGNIAANASGAGGQDSVTVSGAGPLTLGSVTSTHGTVALTGTGITAGAVQANLDAAATGTGAVQLASIGSTTGKATVAGSSASVTGGASAAQTITVTASNGAATLGGATFTGAGPHALTLTAAGAAGDANLGLGTGSVTGATSVVISGARDVQVDLRQGVTLNSVSIGRNLLVRTTRVGATPANAQLPALTAPGSATLSIDGALTLASLTAASARVSAESLAMGSGITATGALEIDSRLGGLTLGDGVSGGPAGIALSNSDFAKLRAAQLTFYAGDPNLTGAHGNVAVGALDIDLAGTPNVSIFADPTHTIQVSGQVAPTTSGGSFTLGSATDANWRPASIGVSGAIGASSSADGIVYTGVRAFADVGLYATADVLLGSSRFQTLIAGAPAGAINIYGLQPTGAAATPGELGHVFLTSGRLTIGAGGKVVGQNTSPIAGRMMGLYLTNALSGPAFTTVLSIDPPTVIDLFGAYVGRSGLLYNQLTAASGGGITVLPAPTGNDRFNGCLLAFGGLCGQPTGVATQVQQVQGLLNTVTQISSPATPGAQSDLVILAADAGAEGGQGGGARGAPAQSAIGDSRGSRQDSELIVTGVGNEEFWRTPDVAVGTGNEELSRKRKEPGK